MGARDVMSVRKAKRRVVEMMASTVVLQFRWMCGDDESRRILRWLKLNNSRVVNMLRKAVKDAHDRPV
jgi:hypothetical protein